MDGGEWRWLRMVVAGGFYNAPTMTSAFNLVTLCQAWGRELGFSQIGVAGVDLSSAEPGLSAWLAAGFHGSMGYMASHGLKRARPADLVPGTVSVITARMDYLPRQTAATTGAQNMADDPPFALTGSDTATDLACEDWRSAELARPGQPLLGTVSVYARGRDYHKVLRARLQKLADRLAAQVGPLGHRVFTDSAPVLEA